MKSRSIDITEQRKTSRQELKKKKMKGMITPGHKNIPVDLFGLALWKEGKTKMLGLSQNVSDTRLIV